MTETTDPQAERGADADTVARRAAQVIATMGADIRALRAERDRYRTAWDSARHRARVLSAEVTRRAPLLAEHAAEIKKLIRWHREDGDALTEMRATIARLRIELKQQPDRAAVLGEAAEVAVRAARGCGDSEAGQYAASVAAGIGKELRRMAGEAQQPTPCSVPNVCEDGGDPCATHEREQAHAEGDHGLCGADPCSGCRYVPCGNCPSAAVSQPGKEA